MPYLVRGTDRRTRRPSCFLSNAATETLALRSAAAMGIDAVSLQSVTPQEEIPHPSEVPAPPSADQRRAVRDRTIAPPDGWYHAPATPPRSRQARALACGLVAAGVVLVGCALHQLPLARTERAGAASAVRQWHERHRFASDPVRSVHRRELEQYEAQVRSAVAWARVWGGLALVGGFGVTFGLSGLKQTSRIRATTS